MAQTLTEPPKQEEKGLMDSLQDLTKETFTEKAKAAIAPVPAQPKPTEQPKPEPKPEPKPAEPTKEPEPSDDEPPPTASPKAKLDWSRATEARKQIKAENKKLKEQLAQAKTDPAIEAIKKENEELIRQLETVAIERSPRFQTQFSNETNAIIEVAKQSLPKVADKVEAILRLPPGAHRDAQVESLSELSSAQATALNVAILDMDKLNFRKNAVLTQQREAFLKELREGEAQREAQSKAQREEWRGVFEETLASAQQHLPIYQNRDGDDEWNKEVDASVELARRVYAGEDMEPVDLAKTAIWAAAAPRILSINHQLMQEVEALKKQIGDIAKATPSPGSGPAGQAAESSDKGFIDTALEEAIKAGFVKSQR